MNFWLTLICGISIGFSLAIWIIGFRLIDWKEIKTMMIRYIFSLRNHLKMKWLKVLAAYLRVLRRLI